MLMPTMWLGHNIDPPKKMKVVRLLISRSNGQLGRLRRAVPQSTRSAIGLKCEQAEPFLSRFAAGRSVWWGGLVSSERSKVRGTLCLKQYTVGRPYLPPRHPTNFCAHDFPAPYIRP